jgi:hypothetical protein
MYFNSKDRDRDGLISFDEFCDRETINERSFRAIDQVNQVLFNQTRSLDQCFSSGVPRPTSVAQNFSSCAAKS